MGEEGIWSHTSAYKSWEVGKPLNWVDFFCISEREAGTSPCKEMDSMPHFRLSCCLKKISLSHPFTKGNHLTKTSQPMTSRRISVACSIQPLYMPPQCEQVCLFRGGTQGHYINWTAAADGTGSCQWTAKKTCLFQWVNGRQASVRETFAPVTLARNSLDLMSLDQQQGWADAKSEQSIHIEKQVGVMKWSQKKPWNMRIHDGFIRIREWLDIIWLLWRTNSFAIFCVMHGQSSQTFTFHSILPSFRPNPKGSSSLFLLKNQPRSYPQIDPAVSVDSGPLEQSLCRAEFSSMTKWYTMSLCRTNVCQVPQTVSLTWLSSRLRAYQPWRSGPPRPPMWITNRTNILWESPARSTSEPFWTRTSTLELWQLDVGNNFLYWLMVSMSESKCFGCRSCSWWCNTTKLFSRCCGPPASRNHALATWRWCMRQTWKAIHARQPTNML